MPREREGYCNQDRPMGPNSSRRARMGEPVGRIRELWRFPVKSMRGEEVDAAEIGSDGVVGDRAYAVRDRETGKIASAKHPKVWPNMLGCRASLTEPPKGSGAIPAARIDLA